MMTSHERVRRALEFGRPDRAPRQLWKLPIVWREHPKEAVEAFTKRWPADIAGAPGGNPEAAKRFTQGDPYAVGEYVDEWGCVFTSIGRSDW